MTDQPPPRYVVGFDSRTGERLFRAGLHSKNPNSFRYSYRLADADVFDTYEAAQAEADRSNAFYVKTTPADEFSPDEVWNYDALVAELRILGEEP